MLSLNLTPTLSFERSFRMFIINSYDRKSEHLLSLDFFNNFSSIKINLTSSVIIEWEIC